MCRSRPGTQRGVLEGRARLGRPPWPRCVKRLPSLQHPRARCPPPALRPAARPQQSQPARPSRTVQTCALARRAHHSKRCHAPRSPDAHALRPSVGAPQHRDKRTKTGFVHNPMDEALLRKCDTMMKGLMKRTQAVHFSKPVDWKKMGLHEYPRIVKQPMDLGTVQERLARHHYSRLEELALDCRLVWVSERTHTPICTPSARMSPRAARSGGDTSEAARGASGLILWISRAPACRTQPCTQHHLLVCPRLLTPRVSRTSRQLLCRTPTPHPPRARRKTPSSSTAPSPCTSRPRRL